MKLRLASVLALSLAFTQVAAPAAFAQEPATQFRSVEARTFSAEELQRYGLSAEDAAQVRAYQEQGYSVQVMTPEEASQYTGGLSNNTWLIIGLVVVVVAVAVASD
jgi:hypothetical protein